MNLKLSPRLRALSLLLALTLILGLLPGSVFAAEAETAGHWADSYLSQMVEWGFIRADQAQEPDRKLTRADFMSIVNRAYGYHEMGPTPFEDVSEFDWYYDDVGIAYNAGYINGTSPTTASPEDELNRETAATILGRNMMLQESAGELLDFSDARDISNWARGTIKSSMEHYLVNGYDDGTFRPQRAMSWGEIAALVTRTIGTPLQDEGDYSLGGVFGNVTITSPGVTLRDTVISGDLYITGGVGLGGVKLENVTVLGRIIASGTGTSEGGASILLRNVSADELLIDSLRDNEVSIQADGITEIGKTTVRTSAYIEDNTPEGLGLHTISLEGDFYGEGEEIPEGWTPPRLTLAGRIEEVINLTPNSTVQAAKGTVAKLTVDETAVDSRVVIDRGAVVRNLILDSGINVSGEGDITRLEVNAPGSNVEMLPDQIVIRPGTTSVIAGHEMDSAAAEEFLLDPMILAGYPIAQDIAPTSLEAAFSGNKQGRIYWAVSSMTNGSIGVDELLKPPSYGNKAIRWGTVDLPRGNEEVTTRITGLTSNGEYYLSAVLEDPKGKLSPVKVISFTTPDNTIPAFNSNYPYMSKVSPRDSVAVVSVNKDCKLYYALLPSDASAPTESDLMNKAVAGALGYGVRDVRKNVEDTFRVNDQILEEKKTYVLYLWLVDADGANKSAVFPLRFTTDDETPPEFVMGPEVNSVQATSVGLRFRLSEAGTVYWVAVPAGTVYPKPQPGTEYDRAPLTSDYAKLQVYSGMNLGTDGKSGRVTAQALVDGTITVSGLKQETSYDFYYVAKDNAGPDRNYSVTVGKMTINTLDQSGPKFTQHFSKHAGTNDTIDPRSDTDIFIDVSENIRYSGDGGGRGFLELYNDIASGGNAAVNKFADNLSKSIWLCKSSSSGISDPERDRVPYISQVGQSVTNWVIDYTKATVTARTGGAIRITFPNSGLQLENGAEYYFVVQDITDTSNNLNPLENPAVINFKNDPVNCAAAGHDLRPFTVEPATVMLYEPGGGMLGSAASGGTMLGRPVEITAENEGRLLFFRMDPDSTDTSIDSLCYDLLLWSDSKVNFDLFYRIVDSEGNPGQNGELYSNTTLKKNMLPYNGGEESRDVDLNGWIKMGNASVYPNAKSRAAASMNKDFNNCASSTFPKLNSLSSTLSYEFAIVLQEYEGNKDHETWTEPINFYINVACGQSSYLFDMARQMKQRPANNITIWEDFLGNKGTMDGKGGKSIGRTNLTNTTSVQDTLHLTWPLDTRLPSMRTFPTFTPTAKAVSMSFNLDVRGYVSYVIGKARSNNGDPAISITRKQLPSEGDGSINVTLKDNPPKEKQPPESGQGIPEWMMGSRDAEPISDNPRLDNTITIPSRYAVQNRTVRPTNGEVVHTGRFLCDGFEIGLETVDGLEPETDYFVYFVLESESGGEPSHVYIYQFRTEVDMKPKIRLNPQSETGYMERSISADHDPTNGYYRMFTEEDAANISIMMKPFKNWVDDPSKVPDKYLTEGDNVFTVLDALTEEYSYTLASGNESKTSIEYPHLVRTDGSPDYGAYNGGYTVFDIYASNGARAQIDQFIQSGQLIAPETVTTSVVAPYGSANTPTTNQTWHDTTLQLKIGSSRYVFLTSAVKSTVVSGSSSDAYKYTSFRGRAYQKGKLVPPKVVNTTGSWIQYDSTNRTYYGQVWIAFDQNTYLTPNKQPLNTTNLPGKIQGNNSNLFKATIADSRGFTLEFNGARADASSISFRPLTFCNQNSDEAPEWLYIRIETVREGNKNTVYLVVEWVDDEAPRDAKTWRIPVIEAPQTYQVNLNPIGDSDKWGGSRTALELELTMNGVAGESVQRPVASIDPIGLKRTDYNWEVTEGKDVISLTDTEITALKVGTAVITVGGNGYADGNPNIQVAEPATITVTVKASTLTATLDASNSVGSTESGTGGTRKLTMNKTREDPIPKATYIISPEIGSTAKAIVEVTTTPIGKRVSDFITISEVENNKFTIQATGRNTLSDTDPVGLTLRIRLVEANSNKSLCNETVSFDIEITGNTSGLVIGTNPNR